MLRTSQEAFLRPQTSSSRGRTYHEDPCRRLSSNVVFSEPSNSSTLPSLEMGHIYNEWIASGKPHNIVCSECRNPDNLMACETCCRSYHAACLSPGDVATAGLKFHCPSCRVNRWDYSPPRFESTASSSVSRASTPSIVGPDKLNTSSGSSTPGSANLVRTLGSTPRRVVSPAVGSPTMYRNSTVSAATDINHPDILSQARQFLVEYGCFPESQEFPLQLQLKLGSILAELESQQKQIQDLMTENAHLRKGNANIRPHFDPNLSTGVPGINSVPNIPTTMQRPPSDTGAQSWDRIMDLL